MKLHPLHLLLFLLSFFTQPLLAKEPIDVSIIQLIANPTRYDGKVVRIIGFMKLEFEGDAIYLHQEDYKHSIYKNGFWIEATEDIQKKKGKLDKRHVILEGVFNAKMTGHKNLWSGSIQKITRCHEWR